ncbi:DUF5129 domain-containing protein [Actinomyces sp. 2119]|uniref:DUF5129 domain-containing protein n=1 Tax=Actinomyces sp. 2119 TaxID=2321393 RepID=UPI000E6D4542|nr:DUF5129 domain-containing protein [Actinomyces sp. 2119]RJF43909.1 DUF5129 domain-containing protein [Actinomyces sp. 2119]
MRLPRTGRGRGVRPPRDGSAGSGKRPSAVHLGGLRAVALFVAVLGTGLVLLVSAVLVVTWPFGRTHHPSVEIHDEADVFQEETLADSLGELAFRQDVHVAVLSVPGHGIASARDFNDTVRDYARTRDTHTPWISPKDPGYWAEGLVILALAPDSRWVGCYFGEDVTLPLDQQQAAQEAARSRLQQADWDGAVAAMGGDIADNIGRPGEDRPAVAVLPVLLGVGGVALVGAYLGPGVLARRRTAAARSSYAQVVRDHEATERAARTIPEARPYGAQVLARYRWFRQEYDDVTRLFGEHGEPVGAQWFSWRLLRRATRLQKKAAELDALDDVVVNAAALLTMGHGWQDAWRNEMGPVLEDLQALRELCGEVWDGRLRGLAAKERQWVRVQKQRLDTMTEELADHRMVPEDALAELDRVSDETRIRVDVLAKAALDADDSRHAEQRQQYYKQSHPCGDSETARVYGGQWSYDGVSESYVPYSTIRLNPSSPGLSAPGVSRRSSRVRDGSRQAAGVGAPGGLAGTTVFFAPAADLVAGYRAAASYEPSSGESGVGGFIGGEGSVGGGHGGGGFSGGFSGSGSSSSF